MLPEVTFFGNLLEAGIVVFELIFFSPQLVISGTLNSMRV